MSVDNFMPTTKVEENENLGHQERVRFLAKTFSWEFLDGGIMYTELAF